MPFIPPKERFSTNAKSVNIDLDVLRDAMSQFGRPGTQVTFQRLSGGFMNANYLVTVDDERVLVRVYSTDATTAARECDLLNFLASEDVLAPGVLARLQIGHRPAAILEFIDGITLEDLGNVFRFEYDYPEVAREEFAAGYRSIEPALPANWCDVAKLLDIGHMCSFLERPEDYQASFRTARTVNQSTLTHFGY
jgi:hypothetical protein